MRLRAILLSTLSATACYRYAPVELHGVSPQEQVVLELTDQGTIAVIPAIGNGVTFIEGRVVARDTSGLTLSLANVRRRGEPSSAWNGETLRLRPTDVRAVQSKVISQKRTVFALASLTAAGTALIIAIARASGAASSDGGGKGPPPPP